MDAKFEELKGKTIVKIEGMEKDSDCIEFSVQMELNM